MFREIETLSGVFKFSREGIQYYDVRTLNMKSGHQVENVLEADLPKPNLGEYQARMPLLYTVDNTYAWFVPIYWEGTHHESSHLTIRLAGLGIVDASNLDHRTLVLTNEGYQGEALIAEAKARFLGKEPDIKPEPEPETTTITGTLEGILPYIYNGYTSYILTINSTEYVAYGNQFNYHEIARFEVLELGNEVSIEINANGEIISLP